MDVKAQHLLRKGDQARFSGELLQVHLSATKITKLPLQWFSRGQYISKETSALWSLSLSNKCRWYDKIVDVQNFAQKRLYQQMLWAAVQQTIIIFMLGHLLLHQDLMDVSLNGPMWQVSIKQTVMPILRSFVHSFMVFTHVKTVICDRIFMTATMFCVWHTASFSLGLVCLMRSKFALM